MNLRVELGLAMLLTASSAFAQTVVTKTVLAEGAELSGPSTIRFAPNGDMWVGQSGYGNLVRMNPSNGQILQTLGIADSVDSISDLDFDAAGNMYFASFSGGTIHKRTPCGKTTLLWDFNNITDAVAINNQDRLFVGTVAPTPALWEVDKTGATAPRLVANISGMDGIVAGPDGAIYAPDFFSGSGQIRRVDVDTGVVTVVSSAFTLPISCKFDNFGVLHVIEYLTGEIFQVDLATGQKTLFATSDPTMDNFDFNANNELYVANVGESFVGQLLPPSTTRYVTQKGFGNPGGIAVRTSNGQDTLYVETPFATRKHSGTTGAVQATYYSSPTPGDLALISTLSNYGTNMLVATSFIMNAVLIFDPAIGKVVGGWGDFAVPVNAVEFSGDLAVAQLALGNVVRASDRAVYISGLAAPAGLAAKDGNLFVTDVITGTLWQAVKNGVIQSPPLAIKTGLAAPEGIAVDSAGRVLLLETGTDRLLRINPNSGTTTVLATDLAIGVPPLPSLTPSGFVVSGVAVSATNRIYVTSDVDHRIWKIEVSN